jgi:hypothetical protein
MLLLLYLLAPANKRQLPQQSLDLTKMRSLVLLRNHPAAAALLEPTANKGGCCDNEAQTIMLL